MTILGIDPGNQRSALVWWDGERVVDHFYGDNDAVRVNSRFGHVDLVAIEMIACMGMAVGREVFMTCVWIGRYLEMFKALGKDVILIERPEIKMEMCNSRRAKDANIRQALIDLIGAPGTKKAPGPTFGMSGDKWSALAVAVTAQRWKDKERLSRVA